MEFKVRGRDYVPAEGISLDRNAWMMRWAKEAGFTAIPDRPAPESDEAARRELERVIEDAFASDAVAPLLAGVLVVKGRDWTREGALEAMAEFSLARGDEVETLLHAFAELVMGFIKRAPGFWTRIGRSSPSSDGATGARDSAPAPSSPTPTPVGSTSSPGSSPATILTD